MSYLNGFEKPKERRKKNILIMIRQAQTIELSTELGINYIPCCKIVLMFYNASLLTVSMVYSVSCVNFKT